jgi:hypothetical protein
MIDPKPPTVEDIKTALREGEAFLSFYFGHRTSFVWAVPKDGPVAFAAIATTAGDIDSKVNKLREALEPHAAVISQIPPFDLALGSEIYSLLLKPVEAGWKSAKHLIVATNGALGRLPLSLLPTAPTDVKQNEELLFASYRDVPWLARHYAGNLSTVGCGAEGAAAITSRVRSAGAIHRIWRSLVQQRARGAAERAGAGRTRGPKSARFATPDTRRAADVGCGQR